MVKHVPAKISIFKLVRRSDMDRLLLGNSGLVKLASLFESRGAKIDGDYIISEKRIPFNELDDFGIRLIYAGKKNNRHSYDVWAEINEQVTAPVGATGPVAPTAPTAPTAGAGIVPQIAAQAAQTTAQQVGNAVQQQMAQMVQLDAKQQKALLDNIIGQVTKQLEVHFNSPAYKQAMEKQIQEILPKLVPEIVKNMFAGIK